MSFQVWQKLILAFRKTICRRVLTTALAGAMVMVLPAIVAAYTLVLRDGRQVEVAGRITVTQTTVTYERAPGFNVTLQLSIIDIPATERINHQPPGSFVQLAAAGPAQRPAGATPARVTITNAQLEPSRRSRLQSEKAYEQRRRELGLPTLEETRRREQLEADEVRETIREQISLKEQDEAYWRARAGALRTELAEVNGQIGYLNARLAELPDLRVYPATIIGAVPFTSGRRPFASGGWRGPGISRRAGIYVAPNGGPNVSGQLRFGAGNVRGRVALNPGIGRQPFGHGRNGFGIFGGLPFGSTYPLWPASQPFALDGSYERLELTEQLNELLRTRAGLQARWRLLEDEARRDGAPPGWLRQ